MVREAAGRSCPVDADTLLRLEHLIIAHQRLPEWGSPKPPMTPEALLVHYADDIDAKFTMMVADPPRRHEPRAGDVEEERAHAAGVSRGVGKMRNEDEKCKCK